MVDEKVLHVHEILKLFINSDKKYTKAELKEEIEDQFGSNLRFKTCSSDSYTFDEIVKFMMQKGKIEIDDNGVIEFVATICS